jgi:hypothetical protein
LSWDIPIFVSYQKPKQSNHQPESYIHVELSPQTAYILTTITYVQLLTKPLAQIKEVKPRFESTPDRKRKVLKPSSLLHKAAGAAKAATNRVARLAYPASRDHNEILQLTPTSLPHLSHLSVLRCYIPAFHLLAIVCLNKTRTP